MEEQRLKEKQQEQKCPFCGYEWKTKSKMIWICCPSCLRKFEPNKKEG